MKLGLPKTPSPCLASTGATIVELGSVIVTIGPVLNSAPLNVADSTTTGVPLFAIKLTVIVVLSGTVLM